MKIFNWFSEYYSSEFFHKNDYVILSWVKSKASIYSNGKLILILASSLKEEDLKLLTEDKIKKLIMLKD